MCVCVLLKNRSKKREWRKTSQLHGSHSASPPAIITTEPGRVNLHAQMHIDRSRGLGTGATSKPARCLFHQLGMKGQGRKEIDTGTRRGREKEREVTWQQEENTITVCYKNQMKKDSWCMKREREVKCRHEGDISTQWKQNIKND